MAKRILRGDAPDQAQKWLLSQPLNAGTVRLRVGNKTLEFAEWSAAAIATAWNASKWPELRAVVAAASGDDVLFTARVAGVPFYIWVTVGSLGLGEGAGQNEVQTIILLNSPTGGTWNVDFDGDDGDIAYNADGATVQTGLLALSTLESGDVTVTGPAGGPWVATFAGRFAGQDVPLLAVDGANLTGGDAVAVIETIQNGATGAAGGVDPEAVEHAVISESAEGALTFDNGDGSFLRLGKTSSGAFTLHSLAAFEVALDRGLEVTAAQLALMLIDNVATTIDGRAYVELADDPAFPTTADEAFARPLSAGVAFTVPAGSLADATITITGLAAIVQQVLDRAGWSSGNRLHVHLRTESSGNNLADFFADGVYGTAPVLSIDHSGGTREIQAISLAGNPHAGAVTVSLDGDAMDPLDFDATAADAEAVAEALAGVGAGNVVCSGGPWPATIYFSFASSLGNLPQMTATDTLDNGDVQVSTTLAGGPAIEITELQRSRGANHADDPLNWQDENGDYGLPERGDQVYCPDGKVDLLWGLKWRSTFTIDTGTNRLLVDGQNAFWDGQKVEVANVGGGLPAGLTANTTYYVRDRDGVFLRLSTTLDGPAVDITTAGTGTHRVGVRIALLETDSRWSGKLGLPRRSAEGFEEYRPRFLEAWITAARIGTGGGNGSQRCHLDTDQGPAAIKLLASQGGTNGAPAVQWLGDARATS
jgi:hypothetical protein